MTARHRITSPGALLRALCAAATLASPWPLQAQPVEVDELEARQQAANAAAKSYVQCARAEIRKLDDSVSPVSEVSAAVNQKCRQSLQNAEEGRPIGVIAALERELMKNNAVLILESRAAARARSERQRQPRPKPAPAAPTT